MVVVIRELPASGRVNRTARVARGAAGAGAATLLAAASHALAGGTITWIALVATALLALPLCVALAGRVGSLWRLALGVSVSQLLYHWSFAGIGTATGGVSEVAPVHASHTMTLSALTATPAAEAADLLMWVSHAAAAVLTIALLHRGEQAALALLRLVLRAIPLSRPRALAIPRAATAVPTRDVAPLSGRLLDVGPISHRGPPLAA